MLEKDSYTASEVRELIQNIALGVSSSSGDAFFEKLVLHLWKLYKMKHILIGEYNESDNSVTTIKYCISGKIVDNIYYSLVDSPCSDVIKDKSAVYTKDVQESFPKDLFFKEFNIQSYLGIRLIDSHGQERGVLACFDEEEISYPDTMYAVLEVFGSRASAEIERMHQEKDLEKRVHERTQELETALLHIKEQTHEQLVDSEKMSSLGSMVAGFTHDINTPLGLSITGVSYIQNENRKLQKLIKEENLSKSTLEEYLQTSLKMAESMANSLQKAKELVRSFKLIAIDQHLNDEKRIALKSYVDDILLSLHFKLKHTKAIVHNHIPISLSIQAHASIFFQIFGNLIINSLKHGFDADQEGEIDINASYENDILHIVYKDNGKGMDAYTQEHIFDQFYTTKKNQGGTGLGMYILHDLIVNANGGKIEVNTQINKGVEFIINMPISPKS